MTDESFLKTDAGIVQIRNAAPSELVDLRHAVLRTGLPRDWAVFPGDDRADSMHVAAVLSDGRVIGCATLHAEPWEGASAYRLRGMATDPTVRAAGVGRAMLGLLERRVQSETSIRLLWCNARVPAIGFYERLGWRIVTEVFDIPTAGPHVNMTKRFDTE